MMDSGEVATLNKSTKASTVQEPSPGPNPYGEWAAAFQTYYGSGGTPPPGYFPPHIPLGPQPNPYLWRGQAMMPPYGSPASYAAMYPLGGMYPSMPLANQVGAEKSCDSKGKGYNRKSKGTLATTGFVTASTGNDNQKPSVNEGFPPSGESGSEGSSDGGSKEGNTKIIIDRSNGKGQEASSQEINAVGLNCGNSANQKSAGRKSSLITAKRNLNGGSNYLNAMSEEPFAVKKGQRENSSFSVVPFIESSLPVQPLQNGGSQDFWCQDDREMKRQRRKQSNRESARRSRLRKQAECEELAAKVETLAVENAALHTQLNQVTEERNKLAAENLRLLEQIDKAEGATTHQTQENSTL